ncbi:hypothetical protein N0V88_007843 [Collariella sp. IMI 366227]|nr:hypothetical protein N0V88_007843 [Collariella sp. IMI 366227]
MSPLVDMPSTTPQQHQLHQHQQHQNQQQPQLKKKPSLRDRLRITPSWQQPKPPPLEMLAEEDKPRFVYKPTHAAADFERLAVSPVSPNRSQRSPLSSLGDTISGDNIPAPRHHHQSDPTTRVSHDENLTPRLVRHPSHSKRYAQDPSQPSNPSTSTTRPATRTPETQATIPKKQQEPKQPLSDYELFLARAEADDRARHEKLLWQFPQPRKPKVQLRRVPEHPQPVQVVLGIDGPHPPRTLRRQASLTQRIVQYIRPPKSAARIETLVE